MVEETCGSPVVLSPVVKLNVSGIDEVRYRQARSVTCDRPIEKRWKENVAPTVIRSELFELCKGGLEKHGLNAVPKLIYAESTNSPLYYLIYTVRYLV